MRGLFPIIQALLQVNIGYAILSSLHHECLLQFPPMIIANRLVTKIFQDYALIIIFWCIIDYKAVYFLPSDSFELPVDSRLNMGAKSHFNIHLAF